MSTSKRIIRQRSAGRWFVALLAAFSAAPLAAQPSTQPEKRPEGGQPPMKLKLESPAFKDGQVIPKKHTEDGADVSPALNWSGVPAEAKELALICDDPDAPRKEPWVHWVIYKIPIGTTGLPEGVAAKPRLDQPPGTLQGRNSWTSGRTIGYRGPAPPKGHGVHHYHFRLYALRTALDLPPELPKEELLKRIKPHVVAETELVGTYQR